MLRFPSSGPPAVWVCRPHTLALMHCFPTDIARAPGNTTGPGTAFVSDLSFLSSFNPAHRRICSPGKVCPVVKSRPKPAFSQSQHHDELAMKHLRAKLLFCSG